MRDVKKIQKKLLYIMRTVLSFISTFTALLAIKQFDAAFVVPQSYISSNGGRRRRRLHDLQEERCGVPRAPLLHIRDALEPKA